MGVREIEKKSRDIAYMHIFTNDDRTSRWFCGNRSALGYQADRLVL